MGVAPGGGGLAKLVSTAERKEFELGTTDCPGNNVVTAVLPKLDAD